jgi:hypothetical protein
MLQYYQANAITTSYPLHSFCARLLMIDIQVSLSIGLSSWGSNSANRDLYTNTLSEHENVRELPVFLSFELFQFFVIFFGRYVT